jgi:hypothetical protein
MCDFVIRFYVRQMRKFTLRKHKYLADKTKKKETGWDKEIKCDTACNIGISVP